jgi:hypothetical protein
MDRRGVPVMAPPRVPASAQRSRHRARPTIRSPTLVRFALAARGSLRDQGGTTARTRRSAHAQHIRARDGRTRGTGAPRRRVDNRGRSPRCSVSPRNEHQRIVSTPLNRRSRSPGSKRRFCSRCVATPSHGERGARVHEGYTSLTPRVAVSCRPTASSGFAGCSTTRPNYRQLNSFARNEGVRGSSPRVGLGTWASVPGPDIVRRVRVPASA